MDTSAFSEVPDCNVMVLSPNSGNVFQIASVYVTFLTPLILSLWPIFLKNIFLIAILILFS